MARRESNSTSALSLVVEKVLVAGEPERKRECAWWRLLAGRAHATPWRCIVPSGDELEQQQFNIDQGRARTKYVHSVAELREPRPDRLVRDGRVQPQLGRTPANVDLQVDVIAPAPGRGPAAL